MSNFIEQIIEEDIKNKKIKQVITRFPPEPNGYLHIGHAKSIYINYFLVAKKYNGKCNLRFDDTNPQNEDNIFVDSIIEDLKWLGWEGDIYFASDYFQQIYEYAVLLIKKGLAYVDETSQENIRKMRGSLTTVGEESKYRNTNIDENLHKFELMKQGQIEEDKMVLRLKIDMKSSNMNLRDPIIYRVSNAVHYRHKRDWNIYPLYDFAHPLEDAIEHITHSFCSLEFENHRPLYDWIITNCDIKNPPHQYEFARLEITKMLLSKRILKDLITDKKIESWSDPVLPTLSGLRRKGYTQESIIDFCEKIGVSKSNSIVDIGLLESCIREELNIKAERVFVVLDPIEVEIINLSKDYSEIITTANGEKLTFSNNLYIEKSDFEIEPPPKFKRLVLGGTVRLKDAYVVRCIDYEKKEGKISKIKVELIENSKSGVNNSIKTKGVIQWIDKKNSINIIAKRFNYLADENSCINNELFILYKNAKAFSSIKNKFNNLQFIRNGYYIRDKVIKDKIVFNETVSLKDTYNKNKG